MHTSSLSRQHESSSQGQLRNASAWVLAGVALLLLACVPISSGAEMGLSSSDLPVSPTEGVLRLAGSDPPTLDPPLVEDAVSAGYVVEIFSGLVSLDPVSLEVVPDIAESWEESDSRTEYTFHLRRDARFHDGKPVTAWDFKYSFQRACNPATGSSAAGVHLGDIVGVEDVLAGEADEVSGIRVLDDHTLQITIDSPKPYFLAKLTHPVAFVVDGENVAEGGGHGIRIPTERARFACSAGRQEVASSWRPTRATTAEPLSSTRWCSSWTRPLFSPFMSRGSWMPCQWVSPTSSGCSTPTILSTGS